ADDESAVSATAPAARAGDEDSTAARRDGPSENRYAVVGGARAAAGARNGDGAVGGHDLGVGAANLDARVRRPAAAAGARDGDGATARGDCRAALDHPDAEAAVHTRSGDGDGAAAARPDLAGSGDQHSGIAAENDAAPALARNGDGAAAGRPDQSAKDFHANL